MRGSWSSSAVQRFLQTRKKTENYPKIVRSARLAGPASPGLPGAAMRPGRLRMPSAASAACCGSERAQMATWGEVMRWYTFAVSLLLVVSFIGSSVSSASTLEVSPSGTISATSQGRITLEGAGGNILCDVVLGKTLFARITGVVLRRLELSTNRIGAVIEGTNTNCSGPFGGAEIVLLLPWDLYVVEVRSAEEATIIALPVRVLIREAGVNCLVSALVSLTLTRGEVLTITGTRILSQNDLGVFLGCAGVGAAAQFRGSFRLERRLRTILR